MNRREKIITYGVLVAVILASRLLLVSQHPGDVDPALYIISLDQMVKPPGDTPFIFNQEMSFGYYYLLSVIDRIVKHNISRLVIILNYLNAIFGVIVILLFGLLARRLAGETVSIFGMLMLLLDHTLWNWSLYGHPGVLSIAFFLLSLYLFDIGITEAKTDPGAYPGRNRQWGYLIFSVLSGLAALLIRVDILLVLASYALLYHYRKGYGNKRFLLLYYGMGALSYLTLKILALGYVMGSYVFSNASRHFNLKAAFPSIVKSISVFTAGFGVLFLVAAIVSIVYWIKKNPKFLPEITLTVFPFFIIVFFHGMDFVRESLPVHPILAFFAALTFERIFANISWGILGIIGIYIVQTSLVYFPMKKSWAQKFPSKPSIPLVVRPVPIGWFLSDRENRWEDERRLYQHALFLSRQRGNILVMCSRLHCARMTALLLQLCQETALYRENTASVPHFRISTPNAVYRVFHWHSKDILPKLFDSGAYHGYSVYFLNNIQNAFPTEMILPEGYLLMQPKRLMPLGYL